jgi:hypothetical protein
VKDAAGNALANNSTWSFTTASAQDTTPPTVSSVAPVSGATNVNVNANVTVTFSEAMNVSTISSSTIELRNPSNALISAAVTYNASTFTATLDPTASLAAGTTYNATVRGGSTDPRVKDMAGNALANNYIWSFTTASQQAPPTTYSIWSPSATPNDPIDTDPSPRELGLKFHSDVTARLPASGSIKRALGAAIRTWGIFGPAGARCSVP